MNDTPPFTLADPLDRAALLDVLDAWIPQELAWASQRETPADGQATP